MHLHLGQMPLGHLPPNQLPLGLAPTGDFAYVRERVRQEAQDTWDALTQRPNIRLHGGRLWFPEAAQSDFAASLIPTSWATSQLCDKLGVPVKYHRKCPPALQDANVNWWLEHGGRHDEPDGPGVGSLPDDPAAGEAPERWLLRAKGDRLRGILSEKYRPFDNDRLTDCLASMLPSHYKVDWFSLSDESFHLRLVDPRTCRQVLPGDDLMAGCHIGNSEVGKRAVTVDILIYRLICQNGLIRLVRNRSLLHQRHVSLSAPGFQDALKRAVAEALQEAALFVDQIRRAARTPVPDVQAVLALLGQQEALSKSFLEAVEKSLRAEAVGQQETVWGLANSLTQASQALSADDRYGIETLAGRLIEHGPPKLPPRIAPLSLPKPLSEHGNGNQDDAARREDEHADRSARPVLGRA